MPARLSNRDRIARLAAEKAAAKKEKEAKKGAKKTRTTKATTTKKAAKKKTTKAASKASSKSAAAKPAGGLKMVWAVCDNTGSIVKTYPYPDRKTADSEAGRLTTSKGKTHFVKSDKVPME